MQSYPQRLQDILEQSAVAKRTIVEHEFFHSMSEGAIPARAMGRFLTGVRPVIEQFPQYMAMNLLKVQSGESPAHELGRRYLIRNIRVEQNHVEYWIESAHAHGISREQLLFGWRSGTTDALSHWCWHTCERDPLLAAMAATNYAIEAATGEWTARVCASMTYESGFPADERKKAMKWLRVHAQYDNTHPWEGLQISTLLGNRANSREIARITAGIQKSYDYVRIAFDDCLADSRSPQLRSKGCLS